MMHSASSCGQRTPLCCFCDEPATRVLLAPAARDLDGRLSFALVGAGDADPACAAHAARHGRGMAGSVPVGAIDLTGPLAYAPGPEAEAVRS